MRLIYRLAIILLTCLAVSYGSLNAKTSVDQKAVLAIAKTRDTRANFVVISIVNSAFEGVDPVTFIGGEFHAGVNHRIEDAYIRVVANCKTQRGFRLLIPLSKRTEGKEAAIGVCGIGERENVQSIKWLGFIIYRFGKAERVQVIDREFVRTYDVMPDGAIVKNIWWERGGIKKVAYSATATSYCSQALPDSAFSEASIERTYVESACNKQFWGANT